MNKLTHDEYIKAFIQRHNKSDWTVTTSTLEGGTYIKSYVFLDGSASMTEVNRPIYKEAKAFVKELGIEIPVTVKLLEIECWNTDDATSYKFYERW